MSTIVMLLLGGGIVLLPFILLYAWNGRERADSRGRPIPRRWHH